MKLITDRQLNTLLKLGVIRNTNIGYTNRKGEQVGVYRTCSGKRFIEDYYVNNYANLTKKHK